jgi:hypothetical protein
MATLLSGVIHKIQEKIVESQERQTPMLDVAKQGKISGPER